MPVVDENNRFISYTHPARARKLLQDGDAEVFSNSPFTIRMKRPVEGKMKAITNFTEFFSKERDIYVQNKSDRLVSLEFNLDGVIMSHRLARTPDPVNLTQFVPFEAVKNSRDLRNLANRNPPAIVFLEEADYREYFERKAKAHKTSLEEELAKANEKHRAVVSRTTLKPETVPTIEEKRAELESEGGEEDQITPRVLGLCLRVGADLSTEEMLGAREFVEELEAIEGSLKPADYEYVLAHGYHKTVKKWAQKRLDVATETK